MKKTNLTSQDLIFGGINGLIFGILLPVVLKSFNVTTLPPYGITIVFFVLLAVLGIYVGYLLSKIKPFFFQLAKFGATGAANFAIDIGVLALLVVLFFKDSITVPTNYFAVFKIISFSMATINSYLWNKFWSFSDKKTSDITKEFGKFILVSSVGIIINVLISALANSSHQYTSIDAKTWAAISAMIGAVAVLTWNFLGYKFIVFKK
jgi:putative flippase GtrA